MPRWQRKCHVFRRKGIAFASPPRSPEAVRGDPVLRVLLKDMHRVGIVGFLHESNTFLNAPTVWDDFASTSLTEGEAMRLRWRGAHHELGGMLAGCDAEELNAVPGFATYAVPSGTLTADCFERIADALCTSVRAMGQTDGLLVALHGATVSERYRDADGEVLSRLREIAGPKLPIVVTLDLHANVSQRMVSNATAIIAYRTNPHLDQRERGLEALIFSRES